MEDSSKVYERLKNVPQWQIVRVVINALEKESKRPAYPRRLLPVQRKSSVKHDFRASIQPT